MALQLKKGKDEFFLPHEIIVNILKRLPMKCRVRFQCVCKHWNELFKTSYFIEEQLHHSNCAPFLLLQWKYPYLERDCGLLDSNKKTLTPLNPPSCCPPYYPIPVIVGSSNGLVCLKLINTNITLLLWNPATREVQYVPKTKNNSWHYAIGFGFNKALNDYKIVGIYDLNRVEVFSVSTWSWKEVLEGANIIGRPVQNSTATGEAIYWIAYKNMDNRVVKFILSFDTAREVFTFIPYPATYIYRSIKLITHESKLALLSNTELWVMEEEATSCGSGQRWNNIKFNLSGGSSKFSPITIWRNEEAVFSPRDRASKQEIRIFLYNLTTHKLKEFLIAGKYGSVCGAFNYVERLVPICNKNSRTSS